MRPTAPAFTPRFLPSGPGRPTEAWALDAPGIRDLAPRLLDAQGRLRVVPAAELADTTGEERLRFGVEHGLYGFPTEELVAFLRQRIGGRRAIEIGAGHGQLARALGIPATDNRQQEEAEFRTYYAQLGQPCVPYGNHVEKLDALAAIARHRPEAVIASWVTHRYSPDRHEAGGSVTGIDEEAVIANCDTYIVIGNTHVHRHKPIWAWPHEKLTPSWLYSRAINGTPDFIAIWQRSDVAGQQRQP